MTLVEAPVQAFAQPHTEQQERGVDEHLRQCRQQAAVEQKGEGEQAVNQTVTRVARSRALSSWVPARP